MTKDTKTEFVGQRIKEVRRANNLSQRQLAKRCGVANATISQIETGRISPTVGMLKKVLDGVPITLSAFFAEDWAGVEERTFYYAEDMIEISEGGVHYTQIGGHLAGKAIQLMLETFPSGADTGRHDLVHEGEECGIILSGELKVTVDGVSRVLRKGEGYYFKSDRPHSFQNDSNVDCYLVSACTPPTF